MKTIIAFGYGIVFPSLTALITMIAMWKSIPSAPNYEASERGEIRRSLTGKILKPWAHKSGHHYVRFGKHGASRQVHHIVLEAFGIKRPEGLECRHRDGNPENNNLRNLVWGTRAENIQDYRRHNGRHFAAKFSIKEAKKIKGSLTGAHGEQAKLARKHRVSVTLINRIALGRTYL